MGFWNGCGRGRFEMVTARVRGRISGANRGNWTVEHAKHAHFSCGAERPDLFVANSEPVGRIMRSQ